MNPELIKRVIGFAELAVFVLLTIFIYKIAVAVNKSNRKPAIIVIRTISIFLLVDGISRAFSA